MQEPPDGDPAAAGTDDPRAQAFAADDGVAEPEYDDATAGQPNGGGGGVSGEDAYDDAAPEVCHVS